MPDRRSRARRRAGTSGAPCPPAATSRDRKLCTTRTPKRSASTAGSPSCQETTGGSCQMVWPGKAMPPSRSARTCACREDRLDRLGGPVGERGMQAGHPGHLAARKDGFDPAALRRASSRGARMRSGSTARGPSTRTSAASMPSSEVPDIRPTRNIGASVMHRSPAEVDRRWRAADGRPRPAVLRGFARQTVVQHHDGRADVPIRLR